MEEIGLEFKKNLKKIYKYFGISLPLWMESRKTLFIFSLIDFILLFSIIRNINLDHGNDNYLIRCIYFVIVWSLFSYINGRYSYLREFKTTINKLYKLFIITVFVTLFVYVLDKTLIIYFEQWLPLGRDNLITIFTLSYLCQSIKFFIPNPLTGNQFIYLVGKEKDKIHFRNYCLNTIKRNKLIFKDINSIDKDIMNFKTIVLLENDYNDFLLKYSYLISENTDIISVTRWCEKNLQRIPVEYLNKTDFDINILLNPSHKINWRLKRFGDVLVSLILLIISSPLIIISAFLIKLEDKGPIFYSQERTGLYGEKFKISKLRTMKKNSEPNGAVWAKSDDPRVTKVGRFLRKSRLDELPQLWSVVTGQMSLIGPRPERPEIEKILIKEIPFYNYRNTIRPGLSGWAQVNYRYGASIEDSKNKFSYEVFYLRNYSFLLDLLIFFKTLKLVINMQGSDPE